MRTLTAEEREDLQDALEIAQQSQEAFGISVAELQGLLKGVDLAQRFLVADDDLDNYDVDGLLKNYGLTDQA